MGLFSSSFLLMCIAIFGLAYANQLKLCVTPKEMAKCETFINIMCVQGQDGMDCVNKIKNNQADITSLDGGDIYIAGKCHGMKPILSESTTLTGAGIGYYAVAVARNDSSRTMKTLQGAKSCHTGVNKTAGWFIPMSVLFTNTNNQLGQASAFFEKSCAPGALGYPNMCELCSPNCERNSNNNYYGYDGAARCLRETDADVAFVKHLTFLSDTDKDDFKLLCLDGTTAKIEDYKNCHLAKVPSHAIVGKNELTNAEIINVFNVIHQTPTATLFSNADGKNIIFSSSTTSLRTVFQSYTMYLDSGYINALPETVC